MKTNENRRGMPQNDDAEQQRKESLKVLFDVMDRAHGGKSIREGIMVEKDVLTDEDVRNMLAFEDAFENGGDVDDEDDEEELCDSPSKQPQVKRKSAKRETESDSPSEAVLEMHKIARAIQRCRIEEARELVAQIEEGKLPLETARGIKNLVETSGERRGDTNRETFRMQLQVLRRLPYATYSEMFFDFEALENAMNTETAFCAVAAKKLIRAFRSHLAGNSLKGNVVILVGPPKSGKTRLINCFRDVAKQYLYQMDCSGVGDSYAFDASSSAYSNGRPSLVVNILIEAGIMNPFVVFDNVDRMHAGRDGDPVSVLARYLNRATNHAYNDIFLNVPIDLSSINYILTAERIDQIPAVLKNQATIIEMGNYELEEKISICSEFVVKQLLQEHELEQTAIAFQRSAIGRIITEKAYEPGLYELIKIVSDIVARESDNAKSATEPIIIDEAYVLAYLQEGNAKAILRLTDSKYECLRKLAERLPNYPRREQDKILERVKDNAYRLDADQETYFKLLAKYPRGIEGEKPVDYQEAEHMMEGYYGADESKEQLLSLLARNALSGKTDGIMIGLIGSPGVGKTNFAQFTAQIMRRPYVAVSMANIVNPAEITGIRGVRIGKVAKAFIDAGTERPVILFDELEKASIDVQNAFLTYLDPIQNQDLVDEFLEIKIPIHQAIVIVTVNNPEKLSYPVFDRLDKIWMDDYTPLDKVEIAKRGFLDACIQGAGLKKGSVVIGDEVLRFVAKRYALGAGFRGMKMMLERIVSACAREVMRSGIDVSSYHKAITEADVVQILGEPPLRERKPSLQNRVGTVNGLAASSLGGEVLPIEAAVFKGNGEYELTGSLGEVMRESARVARAVVRTLLAERHPAINLAELGIHLHAPDGAQKKEGPSAGLAIAVALYSAITGCAINGSFAMSGEINLHGEILPVGGLESKLCAATENGIETVLLSEDNRIDVERIENPDVDKSCIRFIRTLREALDLLLVDDANPQDN